MKRRRMGLSRESSRSGEPAPLRVSLITRIYRPEPSAASLRLGSLADALRRGGTRLRVLTTRPPVALRGADEGERGVSRWPVLRDSAGYVRGYLPYISFDVPVFLRILIEPSADVYVCEPPPTTGVAVRLALALRRRPYVYYAADIWSDAAAATTASAPVLRVVRAMERFAMRGAAHVLAVTEGVSARVRELAPRASVSVVGHGVDLERFAATGSAATERADVVYVGSASEWHGAELALDALIQVMRENSTVSGAFIGQGASWPTLKAEAQRQGMAHRIQFLDTVSPERAAEWLRGARVSMATLVPGKGYDFAVPTKLYASVAVGTPVVYGGPRGVGDMITAHGLGAAASYDRGELTEALRQTLAITDGTPDPALIAWAQAHVSSHAVAKRAVDAITGLGSRARTRPAKAMATGKPE